MCRSKMFIPLLVLFAFAFSGCATTGAKYSEMKTSLTPQQADLGRIYFYRTANPFGSAIQPSVMLNGENIGSAVPNGFFYVDRPSGNYEVTMSTEVEKKLTFVLDRGQTRYVRMSIGLGLVVGRVIPELVDKDVAESEMQSLRYLK
jgi:Protein of unknown function (DUF2846)